MRFRSYIIFLLRDQWMISTLSKAMGVASVGNNFLPIQSKISFHMKKNNCSCPTSLTFELSQYRKSGSTCSSSKPVAASSDCHRLGKALFLARQSYLPKLCWPLILQSNPSIVFSNSLREWLPDDRRWLAGARTWTQTWTLPPDQWVVVVLSAPKPQNKVQ